MTDDEWLVRFRERERGAAEATQQDGTVYAAVGGYSSEEIAQVERSLGVELPRALKLIATRVAHAAGAGEFAFARMGEMLTLTPWRARLERIADEDELVQVLLDRRLLPIGDDYGGRYWTCLDYRVPGEPALVELNLDTLPEDLIDDVDAWIERLGDDFRSGVDALHARFFADVGTELPA